VDNGEEQSPFSRPRSQRTGARLRLFRGRAGAEIGGKIIGAARGETDCRKYRETAGAIEPPSDVGSSMRRGGSSGEYRQAAGVLLRLTRLANNSFVESGLRQTSLGKPARELRREAHLPMKTATEYRTMAEECFRWAREAKAKEVRVSLVQLAQVWLDAASKLDGLPATRTQSASDAA